MNRATILQSNLKSHGLSETDIQKLKDGFVPKGYQVHHELPLDDSGTNDFSNLVLIKNEPYHKVITNYQNSIGRTMKILELLRKTERIESA